MLLHFCSFASFSPLLQFSSKAILPHPEASCLRSDTFLKSFMHCLPYFFLQFFPIDHGHSYIFSVMWPACKEKEHLGGYVKKMWVLYHNWVFLNNCWSQAAFRAIVESRRPCHSSEEPVTYLIRLNWNTEEGYFTCLWVKARGLHVCSTLYPDILVTSQIFAQKYS